MRKFLLRIYGLGRTAYWFLYTRLFLSGIIEKVGKGVMVVRPLSIKGYRIRLNDDVYISEGVRLQAIEKYNGKIFEGKIDLEEGVTLQENCHLASAGSLRIGKGTTLAAQVFIQDLDHGYSIIYKNHLDQDLVFSSVDIGEFCFIGRNVVVLQGTKLGDNCIVGAGSVVKGLFPGGSMIVGNPGRIIKKYDGKLRAWVRVK